MSYTYRISDINALEAAVEAAAEILNNAVKPVLVAGPKLKMSKACDSFMHLADACGYAISVMPSAKGLVPENHPHFIGSYWGSLSSECCEPIVATADASLFVGPVFDDISTLSHTLAHKKDKMIIVEPDRVLIPKGPTFRCVVMKEFLTALALRLKHNANAVNNYRRIYVPDVFPMKGDLNEPLTVNVFVKHVQKMLSGEMVVIAETGDSWFMCQKLRLPEGCRYVLETGVCQGV